MTLFPMSGLLLRCASRFEYQTRAFEQVDVPLLFEATLSLLDELHNDHMRRRTCVYVDERDRMQFIRVDESLRISKLGLFRRLESPQRPTQRRHIVGFFNELL